MMSNKVEIKLIKPSIKYSLINHNGINRIGVHFDFSNTLNNKMKTVAGAKWSRSLKCWHIADTDENRKKCNLENKISSTINTATNTGSSLIKPHIKSLASSQKKKIINNNIQAETYSHSAMKMFLQMLHLKAYSESTIKTYRNEFGNFLQSLGTVSPDKLTVERVKDYLQYCYTTLKLSENTIHSRMNALKFYYEQVLKREKFFWEVPRPKKPMILPKLLNENELRKLFNAVSNKKHKAMLFTAYSAGLRLSEIVNLKLADIDSKRMQILVQRAKGKKDRYVNLSPVLLDILRKYIKEYKPRPRVFLFESEQTMESYPVRTVQQIFSNAKQKAGIGKSVGIHSLRHSFATHLLDKGTDIRYIKDLLGHFNIHTTERYLHVSKQQLVNIISPFDDLYNNEAIEW